jgi:hypothetical protein
VLQKTLNWLQVRRFPVPCQPSGRRVILSGRSSVHYSIRPDDVPYRPDARQTKHHPSGRRVSRSDPSLCREVFVPSCIRPDDSTAHPDAFQYSTYFRFFPSPNMGRLLQPSERCGIPSGRQSALVQTCVQQIRKLLIQLQPSGCLLLMVRTRAYQIWKLRVKDQLSGRSSPMVRTREALYGNYLQRSYNRPDNKPSRPDAALKQERFLSEIFGKSCRTVVRPNDHDHHPDGAQLYFA